MMEWDYTRAGLALLLGLILVSAGWEDAHKREIADWKNLLIVALAPLWWWANDASLWPGVALQLGLAAATFAVFAAAFHFGMMGGGDVKLITALALWLPPLPFLDMLMVMSIAGGAVTLVMLVQRRIERRQGQVEVPYGIAIAAAGLLSLHTPILNQFG